MTKYRIPVTSYVNIEAKDRKEAVGVFTSICEALYNESRLPSMEERDLWLNAEIDYENVGEEVEDEI